MAAPASWFSLTSGTPCSISHWQASSSVSMFSWTLIWYLLLWHDMEKQTQFEEHSPFKNLFLPLLLSVIFSLQQRRVIHECIGNVELTVTECMQKSSWCGQRRVGLWAWRSVFHWAAIPYFHSRTVLIKPQTVGIVSLLSNYLVCSGSQDGVWFVRCSPTMGFLTHNHHWLS